MLVLWEWREDTGQDRLLDLACHSQVAFDRLQLGVLLLRLTDVIDLFDGFLDRYTQVIEVDGLGSEVKGTVVHRLTDISHIAIGGHHDAFEGGITHLIDFCEQRESVHLRHVNIREDDVIVRVLHKQRKRLQSVMGK